jgi:hypothetical protein
LRVEAIREEFSKVGLTILDVDGAVCRLDGGRFLGNDPLDATLFRVPDFGELVFVVDDLRFGVISSGIKFRLTRFFLDDGRGSGGASFEMKEPISTSRE